MNRYLSLFLAMMLIFSLLPHSSYANANVDCNRIKPGQKVDWDGNQIAPGQIGELTILKDTYLLRFVNNQEKKEKLLKTGNTYRIYSFKAEYLGVGGGYYVKRDASVSYSTPSKQKLLDVACANPKKEKDKNNGGNNPTIIEPENLGPQVFNLSTIASKAGMDQKGNAFLYVILHGTPTSLAVVDLNTNHIRGIYPLKKSTSAWGLDVDEDGVLWIGGTTGGELYSYNPNINELKDYGNMLSGSLDTSIQDLTVTDQFVYGSTAYGANVFVFDKLTEKKERTLTTVQGMSFAKSIAVDSDNHYLYVSSGPKANLLIWDLFFNSKTTLPIENYQNESYVEKMKLFDQFLAIKFYPSKRANIIDLSTGTFLNEFLVDSRGFSPKDEQTDEFYYTYQGYFYSYNLKTRIINNTFAAIPSNTYALSLDFIKLKDNPQNILTGLIDNHGSYYLYNSFTNDIKIKKALFPSKPVNLYLLFTDPNKRYIYINGYMSGGLTRFDMIKKQSIQLDGISQLESAIFLNGKIYTGAYPKARLEEITPDKVWDQSQKKDLVTLDKYGQERIPALTSYHNHIFAGTYPQTSTKGGLLLDYDLTKDQYQVYEDYIPNQSIISLLINGSEAYGGSSIHANFQKAKDGAKFFRFDPQNPNEKEFISLPVKASMVMALIKGPDSNIWGAADGTIFSYNPAKNSFKKVKLLNAISGRFGNAKLIVGKDGFIYGSMEGRLFKINPADMSYKILLKSGASNIEEDANGNLYYKDLANLYMYPVK